jgi:membrane-associated phospholipid phosphatase
MYGNTDDMTSVGTHVARSAGDQSALVEHPSDVERSRNPATRWHPVAAISSAAVAGYLVISLLFVGIGLLVTHEMGALTRWDDSVNRWFAQNRTGALNDWTGYATKVANTSGILVVLAAAAIVLFLFRRRWAALVLLIALCLELLSFLTVNYLVDRPRPDVERLGSLPTTSSFPSGHTAAMLALYGGLALVISDRVRSRIIGVICWVVAVLATAAIGFARVYRGMHHPSDVVAGALLGLAALGVATFAVRTGMAAAQRRHPRAPDHSLEPDAAA